MNAGDYFDAAAQMPNGGSVIVNGVSVFVPKPDPKCSSFGCERRAAKSSRLGYCSTCEHDAVARRRREARDKLEARARSFTVGQGVTAKVGGRARPAEVVAVQLYHGSSDPQVKLRYWRADGEEHARWFGVGVVVS